MGKVADLMKKAKGELTPVERVLRSVMEDHAGEGVDNIVIAAVYENASMRAALERIAWGDNGMSSTGPEAVMARKVLSTDWLEITLRMARDEQQRGGG